MARIRDTHTEIRPVEDPLVGVLTRVRSALEGGPRSLSDSQLLDLLSDTERLGRLVDAARDALAAEAGERSRPSLGTERLSARRGCRTPGELVERATLVSSRTARERLRRGGALRGGTPLAGEGLPGPLPLVEAARRAGELGTDACETISAALLPAIGRGAAPGEVFAAEEALVGAATGGGIGEDPHTGGIPMTFAQVATMAQAWALVLDPDGTEPTDPALDDVTLHRFLSLRTGRHGTVRLTGELTVEVGAQLQRLLDAVLNPRVEAGGTGASVPPPGAGPDGSHPEAHGPGEEGPPDGGTVTAVDAPSTPWEARTVAQRRHDAFASILMTAAACPDMPVLGGAAPTLVVVAQDTQVTDSAGVAFLDGVNEELSRVPASVGRQVACTGAVQRITVDPRGRITSLESPSRVFTAHQRRAIAARDGHCVIPGCRVPATWCEVHHVHEWARGGPTTTDNGVLLCWFHHRSLDTSGWRIRMVEGVGQVSPPTWIDPQQTWTATEQSSVLHHRGLRERLGRPDGPVVPREEPWWGRAPETHCRTG